MRKRQRLVDLYGFPGFRPRAGVGGVFGDPKARVVFLERREKKPAAGCAAGARVESTNASFDGYEIFRREKRASTSSARSDASFADAAGR
jgi:hypothetical protein